MLSECQRILFIDEKRLQGEDLIVAGFPSLILVDCDLQRLLVGIHGIGEKLDLLLTFQEGHNRAVRICIGSQHRLLVLKRLLLKTCIFNQDIISQPTVIQKVPTETRADVAREAFRT